ncbi:divalent-cation tolerance protein CutA [Alteromonas mediterranea]|jgi:periplasmic divalent cation tolerance protein|uniref:Divalent cation transporter n=3 Tax=Alteromonadales TaxID=135622 RepID=A0AAC8XMT8_9ALTE|nr:MULTISPECIES: divalent-cation tolerance protein CutA [Alteromonas]AGP95367.1 divalent cation tolerance protein [Alteromonas mediterranea U8]MBR9785354.1 divalent-cation tolerance protein CutA [Gammaproteobacteria bacterium]MDY6884416.1 divalent-cation tolerance protein CutA [Pseudomonadota bacterium]AEB00051.1 divalent cation transporter [Alteromonas mediterranea DE]AFV87345.1 divalent cation tolerance protein [Alteromonas mediterranea DE1]|tara:strand:+ start:1055 stop:1369 length:315 start_codon:yes stop_codon:yes gene_type:complete
MTIKLVLCTTPDEKSAQDIATALVKSKLAACVNIIKGIQSVYEWQGKVEVDAECQLLIKTNTQNVLQAFEKVSEIHPYDVPEWLELNAEASSAYGQWLQTTLQQ